MHNNNARATTRRPYLSQYVDSYFSRYRSIICVGTITLAVITLLQWQKGFNIKALYKPNKTSLSTMEANYPDLCILSPSRSHENTLILLHGTSQDGPSFAESLLSFSVPVSDPSNPSTPSLTDTFLAAQEAKIYTNTRTLPQLFPHTRIIFPTGRHRFSTVLNRPSHAWFDFASFSNRTVNESLQIPGLAESSLYLGKLLDSEVEVLLSSRVSSGQDVEDARREARKKIVLGGFSQGSAMACIALLSGEVGEVGAFVGLSGWLPFRVQIRDFITKDSAVLASTSSEDVASKVFLAMQFIRQLLGMDEKEKVGDGGQGMKVFLGHGADDRKMLPHWGREMGELLKQLPLDVSFKAYEGLEHWWNMEEMADLAAFLRGVWDDTTD